MHLRPLAIVTSIILAASLTDPVLAQSPRPSAAGASSPASPWSLHLRYRYEGVEDAAFAQPADAHTLRLRMGWSPELGGGFSALLEGEAVVELNDRFNSGANRETGFPSVTDARALEINQAWVDWQGEDLGFRVGRQRILLDNGRFFADSAWRQNSRSFDALQLRWLAPGDHQVEFLHLDRVHQSAGDNAIQRLARERNLDAQLLRLTRALSGGTLVAYGYWFEDQDVPAASTRSIGLHYTRRWSLDPQWTVALRLEAARQQPWAQAIGNETGYHLIEPSLERGPWALRLGWERLGGGRDRAFQTPVGSTHAFNGWADQFTQTPLAGLEDHFVTVQGVWSIADLAMPWILRHHHFQSDQGQDYGSEWNAQIALPFRPGWSALLKWADFQSRGFSRDTRKVWFQIEWSR